MDHLTKELDKWGFLNKGFDYYVVAILGCQSSGKSKYPLITLVLL
jgi:hypothetical protein